LGIVVRNFMPLILPLIILVYFSTGVSYRNGYRIVNRNGDFRSDTEMPGTLAEL